MRVLLAEDEIKTHQFVRRGLTENGYAVDVAETGTDALELAFANHYDLVILDVMLPAPHGWQILTSLRASGSDVPVLFLTARDSVADRVKGLELGADDYLVKPFAFAELLARVRTLTRRRGQVSPQQLRIADLELDLKRRRATRQETSIELTAREFALLWLLMRRSGEVLSRSTIAEKVWDMNFDSDTNVVDVAVRRLRRKVDDAFPTPLIHTVRGVGYVLEAPDSGTDTPQ